MWLRTRWEDNTRLGGPHPKTGCLTTAGASTEVGQGEEALFGESVNDLRYYWLREYDLDGIPLIVSRTGWSSELGYELYLQDGSKGDELWERIMAAGAPFGLQPGHTSTIRRIEGGMLSYHADMDITTNPYELGMDRLIELDMDADFIGKSALKRIRDEGVTRKQVGLIIDGLALTGPNSRFWALKKDGVQIGKVTSAVFSPRLQINIALAMVGADFAAVGTSFDVETPDGRTTATVVAKPFYDPNKKIAVTAHEKCLDTVNLVLAAEQQGLLEGSENPADVHL